MVERRRREGRDVWCAVRPGALADDEAWIAQLDELALAAELGSHEQEGGETS